MNTEAIHDRDRYGILRLSTVIVMNFTGVYDRERFAHRPSVKCLDCTHLNGTDCYCDAQGAASIRRLIARFPPNGIHFIDNGNHHYATKFWTEKISEPFALIVFDHHTDVQPPAWDPKILSCGGWIADELVTNPLLRQVLVIGPSPPSVKAVPDELRHRIRFFGEDLLNTRPDWVSFAEEHLRTPVYISIDKDVLSPDVVPTNWDQGHVTLKTLQTHLRDILLHEQVIGVDICGECSALLDQPEEDAETSRNNQVNELLLAFLQHTLPRDFLQMTTGNKTTRLGQYHLS